MEEILINKKQCEWVDDGWHQTWKVTMPQNTSYDGYAFEVSGYLMGESENKEVLRLKKPRKDDYVFVLTKIRREPGKRYARPKLNWQELCDALAEHSAANDKSALPQGLAYIYDYDYDRGIEVSREGHYALGGIEGCWFWENGTKKRRSSAKNFRLLRMIETGAVAEVQAKLERLADIALEVARIESIERQFDRIKSEIDSLVQTLQSATDAFLAETEAAKKQLAEEQSAIIRELEQE